MMRSSRLGAIFAIALFFDLIAFTQAESILAQQRTNKMTQPPIVLKPCRLPGVAGEARCGMYEVREDRQGERSRRITLKVVVLPALSAKRAEDALFVLAGGPGQAATEQADFIARTFAKVRQERDIVLVDQRGTGSSNGLHCNLYGEKLQGHLGDLFPAEAINLCYAQWERRADLRFYTTSIAMDDLDEVRSALGYDKINLFGASYGTRAAQVYLRHYPDRVRTVILKGTTPISDTIPPIIARDAQRSLNLLFDDCGKNETCRKAFPNLKQEFAEVLARFEKGTVTVGILNDETGKVERGELSRNVFVTTLRSLLQSTDTIAQLPLLIHEVYKGDYVSFARTVLSIRRGFCRNVSIGVFLSVMNEDLRLFDPEMVQRESAGTFIGEYYYQQLLQACSLLPRGTLSYGYREPVISYEPVLLISGFLDPAAPPENGEKVAQNLPNSLHVVVRYGSDSYTGLSPCFDNLMSDFITRGHLKGVDTSCVDRLPKISFQTPNNQTNRDKPIVNN